MNTRTKITDHLWGGRLFFVAAVDLCRWLFCPEPRVRDQVTEPSASGGRCSEAEEAQNKEHRPRLRGEATMFSRGSHGFKVSLNPMRARGVKKNSPVDCFLAARCVGGNRANAVAKHG